MKQKVMRGRKQKQFITVFDWRVREIGKRVQEPALPSPSLVEIIGVVYLPAVD
jgi:hypothetical protein